MADFGFDKKDKHYKYYTDNIYNTELSVKSHINNEDGRNSCNCSDEFINDISDSDEFIKRSIKEYRESVISLRDELEKAVEKGVIMCDFENRMQVIKNKEEHLMYEIIPLYRGKHIENTPVKNCRLGEIGSYRINGIAGSVECIGSDLYILSTSDNEIGIFRTDLKDMKIEWIYVEKIDISSISSMQVIVKGKLCQAFVFGISGEVFLCEVEIDECNFGNSDIEIYEIYQKYDEYGFDMVKRYGKYRFSRRVGEREIEIFEVDEKKFSICPVRRIKTGVVISDYIFNGDSEIILADKTGSVHLMDFIDCKSDTVESSINTLYETDEGNDKICGIVKSDGDGKKFIWIYFSGGGYLYCISDGIKTDFIEKKYCEGEVFHISSDGETALILSDSGKNIIMEENSGRFYKNGRTIDDLYVCAKSIGGCKYIAFEVDGTVDFIEIERINSAEKLYNSRFVKSIL